MITTFPHSPSIAKTPAARKGPRGALRLEPRAVRRFCSLVIPVAVACAVTTMGPARVAAQQKGENLKTLVSTARAVQRDLSRTQEFIGTLQPVRRALIGSAVEERVARLLVQEGDFVTGTSDEENSDGEASVPQPLIELDRTAIELELEAARIELGLREKALEELEVSIPVELELSQARVKQSEAQRDYTRNVFERLTALGNTASTREIEEARSLFQTQTQVLVSAEAELKRLESTRDIRIRIARQNIEAQQAELQRITDLRERYTIRAPFSGYITQVMVEQGNWVTRGMGVMELIQLDFLEIRVNVPQEYFVNLQQTMADRENLPEVAVFIDSLGTSFTGNIVELIPQADERTRTVPVLIRIPNPEQDSGFALVPGLMASATLPIGNPESKVMVPKDAIVLSQSGSAVFVVRREGDKASVERVPVTTGSADKEWIAVEGAIHDGDEVVVQGNEQLRGGQEVVITRNDSRP